MLIELADALRCPAHAGAAHLVLSVESRRGGRVWRGTLGCPVCRAVYPIEQGVAHFGVEPGASPAATAPASDPDEAFRVAALLGLAEPGGIVLLERSRALALDALRSTCAAHYVVLDASFDPDDDEVSAMRVAGPLPFADGVLRAAALGESDALDERVAAAGRATVARGRVLAPVRAALSPELRRLAADERDVVAEREPPASAPVPLRRARPFTSL